MTNDHLYFISLSTPTLAVAWDACHGESDEDLRFRSSQGMETLGRGSRRWLNLHLSGAGRDVRERLEGIVSSPVSVKLYPPDTEMCFLYTGHLVRVGSGEYGGRRTLAAYVTLNYDR